MKDISNLLLLNRHWILILYSLCILIINIILCVIKVEMQRLWSHFIRYFLHICFHRLIEIWSICWGPLLIMLPLKEVIKKQSRIHKWLLCIGCRLSRSISNLFWLIHLIHYHFHFSLFNHWNGLNRFIDWSSYLAVSWCLARHDLLLALHYISSLWTTHFDFFHFWRCPYSTCLSWWRFGSAFIVQFLSYKFISVLSLLWLIKCLPKLTASGRLQAILNCEIITGYLISWFFVFWSRHNNILLHNSTIFWVLIFNDGRWHAVLRIEERWFWSTLRLIFWIGSF